MQHTFESSDLVVGEGQCSKRIKVREVHLTVETAPRDYQPPANIPCPFLNGKIKAEGNLFEECAPNRSLLSPGKEAVLKLAVGRQWSLVRILVLELKEIRSPEPKMRHYRWTFLVVGQAADSLQLFAKAGVDPNALEIEDLLELLGATAEDVGKTPDGRKIVYNAEGGFQVDGA